MIKEIFRSIFAAKFFLILLVVLLLSAQLPNSASAVGKFSDCLMSASLHQDVSLGKPLAIERLANKEKVKIGVLPFYFKDSAVKVLTENEKRDYLKAAENINLLSNNLVSIEFTFFSSVNAQISNSEFKEIFLERDLGWQNKDLNKSTWGFLKRLVINNDQTIDYSGLDGVILEGANLDKSFYIAEAMMFFRSTTNAIFINSKSDFFSSIKTNEAVVDNGILLDSHRDTSTITHEILHNFGLTDLYGSNTGPRQMTLMASNSINLLNYEKAVLGWFPSDSFKCTDYSNFIDLRKVENTLIIDNYLNDSINLLKINEEKAYVFEVISVGTRHYLLIYLFEQNIWPPITVFTESNNGNVDLYDLSDPMSVGRIYRTPDFDLLLFNKVSNSFQLNLTPKSLIGSEDAKNLVSKSLNLRNALIEKQNAEIKAEAEAKAKAEAEAKAKADADTKAKVIPTKTTITCIKGKTLKKVTAINPKCPAGYKKK